MSVNPPRNVIVYCTDFGDIEFPYMTAEQADARYRAMVTREWFLCGDRTKAEMRIVEPEVRQR